MAARFLIILLAVFSQAYFVQPAFSAANVCMPQIKWEPACGSALLASSGYVNSVNRKYQDIGGVEVSPGVKTCRVKFLYCQILNDAGCASGFQEVGVVNYATSYQYYKCPESESWSRGVPPANLQCKCDQCQDKAGKPAGSGGYYKTDKTCSNTAKIFIQCFSGCQVLANGGICPAGSSLTSGKQTFFAYIPSFSFSGEQCSSSGETGESPPEPSQSKPSDTCNVGQTAVSINGKTVCYCLDGQKADKDGMCGGPGSDQSSPGSDQSNPGSDQSSPESDQSSPGSDQSKPTEEEEQEDSGDEFPQPDHGIELEVQNVPSDLTLVPMISSSGSCPAPIQLPKGLGSMSFEPVCKYASAMRSIVIALGFVAAGFIVFGGKKGD